MGGEAALGDERVCASAKKYGAKGFLAFVGLSKVCADVQTRGMAWTP